MQPSECIQVNATNSTGTSLFFTNKLPFAKVVNLEKKWVDFWCSGGDLHCSDYFKIGYMSNWGIVGQVGQ